MKIPATMRLDVALSPVQRMLIEELRGLATPEKFLCKMIELGLTEMIYNTARFHHDDMLGELGQATIGDHEQARTMLFQVKDATQPPTTPPESPTTEGPAPNGAADALAPNYIPRGARR